MYRRIGHDEELTQEQMVKLLKKEGYTENITRWNGRYWRSAGIACGLENSLWARGKEVCFRNPKTDSTIAVCYIEDNARTTKARSYLHR